LNVALAISSTTTLLCEFSLSNQSILLGFRPSLQPATHTPYAACLFQQIAQQRFLLKQIRLAKLDQQSAD